jgi:hypothetical protein
MAMETVRMGAHVQTMGRQAATVVFPEVIASVIVIVIASRWELETAAAE